MGSLINFHPHGHESEKAGAEHIAPKRMPQAMRLLKCYENKTEGLTDEEAADIAGLSHVGYWKRCSDLRNLGYITTMLVDGHEVTRPGKAGVRVIVCFITNKGRSHAQEA